MFDALDNRALPTFPFRGIASFFGIGMGPSKGETTAATNTGNLANWTTSEGEGDTSLADNFWKGILSGNQQTISTLLGPQINAITGGAQQSKNTTAQFSNRSGGTNASIQATTDNTRGAIQNLVGNTTAAAVTQLGSSGSSLLGQGLQGDQASFGEQNTIQQQRSAQISDIFGSITSLAGSLFGAGSDSNGILGSLFSNESGAAGLDASVPYAGGSGGGGGGLFGEGTDM